MEPAIGVPLPGAEHARIDRSKLYDYALDPGHAGGGADKAVVFASALGYARSDWLLLRDGLLRQLPANVVTKVNDGYVKTYEVRIAVTGPNGRTRNVVSAWKYVAGVPHLVTAYVDV